MKKNLLAFVFMLVAGMLHAQATQDAYAKELQGLYKGSVKLIQPQALEQVLESKAPILLLDTRSKAEYSVSHLSDARYVDYNNFKENSLAHMDRATPVVVYCTVGYRSERIGERLQKMGFKNVHNLYGGIFEWVNQGHPVVGVDGKPTAKVHAYNKDWGRWLLKDEKVYE